LSMSLQLCEFYGRVMMFQFTNNSDYTITHLMIQMQPNDDVTQEKLDEHFGWWTGDRNIFGEHATFDRVGF